jgi:hypothetical protein
MHFESVGENWLEILKLRRDRVPLFHAELGSGNPLVAEVLQFAIRKNYMLMFQNVSDEVSWL